MISSAPSQPGSHPATFFPARPSKLLLLLFFLAAAVTFWLVHRGHVMELWLEDLPVYERAIADWLSGRNPYNADLAPLYFLYPPVFLAMAGVGWHVLPSHWGPFVYGTLHLAATIAIPLVLARYYFRRTWMGPLFALLIFFASPRFTGVLALAGMNIASILYCLAFIAGIPGIKRNRWEWFYLAVFFAAIIKVTFLALLLLPLLAGKRQWLRSIACGALVVAVNFGQRLIWPDLYAGYQWALHQGILIQQSYGYGVFGVLASYHHTTNPKVGAGPYIVSLLISLGLFAAMLLLRRRLERLGQSITNPIWLALIVVAVILVNPREMQYDVDIALFAGFVLWAYAVRARRLLILMTVLFLPSLLVPLVVLNPHLHGFYETALAFAAFALGYWRLWQDANNGQIDNAESALQELKA